MCVVKVQECSLIHLFINSFLVFQTPPLDHSTISCVPQYVVMQHQDAREAHIRSLIQPDLISDQQEEAGTRKEEELQRKRKAAGAHVRGLISDHKAYVHGVMQPLLAQGAVWAQHCALCVLTEVFICRSCACLACSILPS